MTVRVHRHEGSPEGFFVNSYLVESATAVVAVDSPYLESDARRFRALLDSLSKPLAGVLITHDHPDHYNGITTLVTGHQVPIVATAATAEAIRRSEPSLRQREGRALSTEWPAVTTLPDTVVADGQVVLLADLRFRAHDLGPGEAASTTVWTADGIAGAFVGDTVANRMHPYLGEGRSREWLDQLDRLDTILDEGPDPSGATVYVGHGVPAGREAISWQREYLTRYRDVATRFARSVAAEMHAFDPDAGQQELAVLGAGPVAAELFRIGSSPDAAGSGS